MKNQTPEIPVDEKDPVLDEAGRMARVERLKELHLALVGEFANNAAKHIQTTKAQAFMMVIVTEDGQLSTMKTVAPGAIASFDDIENLLSAGCTPAEQPTGDVPQPEQLAVAG